MMGTHDSKMQENVKKLGEFEGEKKEELKSQILGNLWVPILEKGLVKILHGEGKFMYEEFH